MSKDNIEERIANANRRVAEAQGKAGGLVCTADMYECPGDGLCEKCTFNVERDPKDYASGPSEFLVLLGEIREALKKEDIEPNIQITITAADVVIVYHHHSNPWTNAFRIAAPTLALAVSEAWLAIKRIEDNKDADFQKHEVDLEAAGMRGRGGECRACRGSGKVKCDNPDHYNGALHTIRSCGKRGAYDKGRCPGCGYSKDFTYDCETCKGTGKGVV